MTNEVDSFKRARELKGAALLNIPILQSAPTSSFSQPTIEGSEDTLITTLRNAKTRWADIISQLNARRAAAKEAPTWTEASVYSRFILNNPAIATPTKEVGFEPTDYAHLKNAGSGREATTKAS